MQQEGSGRQVAEARITDQKNHHVALHTIPKLTAAFGQTQRRYLSAALGKELEKSWRFLRFLPTHDSSFLLMHSDVKRSRQP